MKSFFTLAAIFISSALFAQKNTFLGLEGTITNDVYEFSDNGNNIESTPLVNASWGITVGQEINDHFRIETGVIRKYYAQGFQFNVNSVVNGGSTSSISSWQIPLRLRARTNLLKEKIFLSTVIGYHFCINSDYGSYGYGGGTSSSETDKVDYTYTFSRSPKTFSLIETGIGLEFKLFKKALFTLSTSYYTGFKKTVQLNINYSANNGPSTNAKAYSKGEYWCVGLGLRYPISDLCSRKTAE